MSNKWITQLALWTLLIMQFGCSATALAPYEATYTTKVRGINVSGVRKLEPIGDNVYRVSWKAQALWMRLQEWSDFELVDNNTIRPISYHYTRKGLGSDKPIHVLFDWNNATVSGSKGKKTYTFDLPPNTLDKLSYQIQMQLDLLNGPRPSAMVYQVANYKRIKPYQFDFVQTDNIDTRLGNIDTLVYSRRKGERETSLWLSPAQDFLPVKIEQVEEGDASVVTIKSWTADENSKRLGETDSTLVADAEKQAADSQKNLELDNTDF